MFYQTKLITMLISVSKYFFIVNSICSISYILEGKYDSDIIKERY